jgi:hypothetical protein
MSQYPVRIPGGRHLSDQVHVLRNGERVRRERHLTQKIDAVGNVLLEKQDLPLQPPSSSALQTAIVGDSIPNWVADAYWENTTGSSVESFATSWEVPKPPTNRVGQVIYLFSGMEPAGPDSAILQPVLQWGTSPSGGGPFWSVASYYVIGNGPAFSTDSVPVNPGDVLHATIRLEGSDTGGFNYISEFDDLPGTALRASSVHELIWCYETLESYGAYSSNICYPPDADTAFSAIDIRTLGVNPAIEWTTETGGSNNGQRAVSPNSSEVDIYYR